MPTKCEHCAKPIPELRLKHGATSCSKTCSNLIQKNKCSSFCYPDTVKTGTVGAIHELVVSIDLMKRGLPVFRALSSACACDLGVLCNGRLLRFEVTTGYIGCKGSLSYPKHKKQNFDVIAVVSPGGITYLPALEEWFPAVVQVTANDPEVH